MFEIDGVLFSLSELQAEATKKNVSFEQFLINNPQIKDVSKQPQAQVKQGPSIAMQQIAVKSALKTTPGGVLAEKFPSIAGGIIGIGGFLTDFVPGIIEM